MKNSITNSNGDKIWYNDKGQYHREDGPAVEFSNGTKYWYINGKLHRENGPAVEWVNCNKEWHINGKLHREDGPAIEWLAGSKSWWYNDKCIGTSWEGFTQEDFERYLKIKEYW